MHKNLVKKIRIVILKKAYVAGTPGWNQAIISASDTGSCLLLAFKIVFGYI
jgi:hypothetical protein